MLICTCHVHVLNFVYSLKNKVTYMQMHWWLAVDTKLLTSSRFWTVRWWRHSVDESTLEVATATASCSDSSSFDIRATSTTWRTRGRKYDIERQSGVLIEDLWTCNTPRRISWQITVSWRLISRKKLTNGSLKISTSKTCTKFSCHLTR